MPMKVNLQQHRATRGAKHFTVGRLGQMATSLSGYKTVIHDSINNVTQRQHDTNQLQQLKKMCKSFREGECVIPLSELSTPRDISCIWFTQSDPVHCIVCSTALILSQVELCSSISHLVHVAHVIFSIMAGSVICFPSGTS